MRNNTQNVKFIAEVSSNHNKDINRCIKFIEAASKIGCYAIKFQLFRIDKLFAPEIIALSKAHQARKQWELPLDFLPVLSKRCRQLGIKFSCTPFYLEAVRELRPYVDFYKIASYELLRTDLIKACGKTGLPVILSTGMADANEVNNAVRTLKSVRSRDYALLHCVSSYPTPFKDCNLSCIKTLKERFSCTTGWSDHSVSEEVICRAVFKWGAEIVEFHLDLEGKGKEFGFGHCWLPENIGKVIAGVNHGSAADGDGKIKPVKSEVKERIWRADPSDGLRPLLKTRKLWLKENKQ